MIKSGFKSRAGYNGARTVIDCATLLVSYIATIVVHTRYYHPNWLQMVPNLDRIQGR